MKNEQQAANPFALIAALKFEDVKLIKAAGSAMLGIVTKQSETEFKITGIACGEMPCERDFIKLFTDISTGDAKGVTVGNPQNTTTLDMAAAQKMAFAGAHAKFLVALEMRENALTKVALGNLL